VERVLRRLSLQNLIPGVNLKSVKVPIHEERQGKASPFKHKSGGDWNMLAAIT
jgi:hypothetical protein